MANLFFFFSVSCKQMNQFIMNLALVVVVVVAFGFNIKKNT